MTIKPSDSVSWFQILQRGQRYMKTWPSDKRLAPVFPENRVSNATRFGIRLMPPLAIFTLTWQIALGGQLYQLSPPRYLPAVCHYRGCGGWVSVLLHRCLPRCCNGFSMCAPSWPKPGKRWRQWRERRPISHWPNY